ncbi:hypothetical protein QFZ29_001796 [Agromyces albus]|nr:hypothetical protein [Agromyces albus]
MSIDDHVAGPRHPLEGRSDGLVHETRAVIAHDECRRACERPCQCGTQIAREPGVHSGREVEGVLVGAHEHLLVGHDARLGDGADGRGPQHPGDIDPCRVEEIEYPVAGGIRADHRDEPYFCADRAQVHGGVGGAAGRVDLRRELDDRRGRFATEPPAAPHPPAIEDGVADDGDDGRADTDATWEIFDSVHSFGIPTDAPRYACHSTRFARSETGNGWIDTAADLGKATCPLSPPSTRRSNACGG